MRIVFMGSPAFSVPVLERLADSGHSIVAVYTQPDRPAGRGRQPAPSPVKSTALQLGLPVHQPLLMRDLEEVAGLRSLAPDLIAVAAFGQILPESVLSIPRFGCLNVHPSLLPRHRGAAPVAYAILAGDAETGVSIMLMDSGMDTGPVVAQQKSPISDEDTTGTLTERLSHQGASLLADILPPWFNGELKPRPQDNSRATYSRPLRKEDGEIDWSQSAIALWRQVRAFQPWPGCYTRWQGKTLKILKAAPVATSGGSDPGTVVLKSGAVPSDVGVQTGDGVLALAELQIEGKKPMRASDFIRGQRGFVGSRLPS